MSKQEQLSGKLRLYSELEQERELNKINSQHYLNIEAFDILLSCAQRLVKIDEDMYTASIDIKNLREAVEEEAKEFLL